MTGLKIRYNTTAWGLVVGEAAAAIVVGEDGAGTYLAHLDDVREASATGLRNALAKSALYNVGHRGLNVSDVERSLFDEEYSIATEIGFSGGPDGFFIDIVFFLNDFEDEAATESDIRRTIGPILSRHTWRFIGAEMDPSYVASPWLWHLRVEPRTHGQTVGALYEIAEGVLALVAATAGKELRRDTTVELLRAGRADALIGQPEGDWLDAKSQDYDLSTEVGKISLAQDVARFANAEYGGIVVIGMGTRKLGHAEVIRDIRPIHLDPRGVRRHRQAIDNRLFPPADELTVEEVFLDAGRIIVVHVPPQPEELKPFLVHGAIVGGRVEGAFISIVRRRGEGSIPVTAAAIHSTLAAGRALLRRREFPKDSEAPTSHE